MTGAGSNRGRVLAEVGGPVDEVAVTLSLHGHDLDPDESTKLLGCSPTSSHRRGDARRDPIPPWPRGAWLLRVEGKQPIDPEQLLASLFDRLPKDRAVWDQLRAAHTLRIGFGLFMGAWNRGFALSPAMLRLIAMRAELGFDIYADMME